MINIIFNGFYRDIMDKVLVEVCRNISIDYIDVVYCDKIIENLPVKEAQFVEYRSLLQLEKSLGDPNDLIPLDEELITKMANCERMVLKMMDRMEVDRRYSYRERQKMYYFYLRYWNTIIETHRVNLFVSSNVPHEIFDYVIYELCKLKKIPTIFLFHQSQIEDMGIIMHDWRDNCLKLKSRFIELKKQFKNKSEAEINLSDKLQRHFDAQISDSEDAVPFYMKSDWRIRFKFITDQIKFIHNLYLKGPKVFLFYFKKINWGSLVSYNWKQLAIGRNVTNIYHNFYYRRHSVYPDLDKKYIYVPLHYQPELTTSPLADVFVDQRLIVQMLSKYLPDNMYLYVKEHPIQNSFCRSIEFYKDILQTKNVVLVRKDSDSFDLIKHCVAVATSTGTPGWEALFRGIPVLMFGSYIYQFADGVYKIKTNSDCQQALDQILNHRVSPSLKSIKLYLKALGEVSISAVIDPNYLRVSKLSKKENIRNISEALIQEINQTIKARR
ncbi:MAG: hypothetical protein NTZ65_03515 [Candidatus Berkelbacteria bacterium]|nr:hypothetical protein [Candidatus Berkelbacteria bacterium]